MEPSRTHTRRRLLAAAGVSVATAGCLRLVGGGDDSTATDSGTGSFDPDERIERASAQLDVELGADAIASPAIVGSCRADGQEVLDGAITFNAYTPEEEQIKYVDAVSREQTTSPPAYSLARQYAFDDDRRLRFSHTVSLSNDRPIITIETHVTNNGDRSVTIDRPDSHLHDGWLVTQLPRLADISGPYRYYVSGNNVYSAAESEYWQEHFVESDRPFVTNFDDEKGISVGILDGPTGVTNAVTRRIDDEVGGIDLCVGGVVLDPDATATYRSVVAVHDGGEAVPDRPRELIDAAAETG